MVADFEGPGQEQNKSGEDVPEALLSGNAEHYAGEACPDEHVVDGDPETEHLESGDDDNDVADSKDNEANRRAGSRDGAHRDDVAEAVRDAPGGDEAEDDERPGA